MRGLRAGVLALAAACGSGCKDNPGFALAPDGPAETGDTVAETGGMTTTPEVSTSLGPETTDALTTTTGEPHSTSSSTGPPERMCGDGVTDEDLGEQCDDGNAVPNDACTNGCLDLFADDDAFIEYDGTCIGLLAAQFSSGDESIDLALVIDSDTVIPVLENDGEGVFSDMNHSFATGNSVVNVAVTRDLDGKGGKDIVALHSIVSVCINKSDEGYCLMPIEYAIPPDFQDALQFFVPKFLQAGDLDGMTDNNPFVDVVAVGANGDALAILRGKTGGALDEAQFQALPFPAPIKAGATTAIAVGPFTGQVELLDLAVGYEDNAGGHVMYFPDFGVNGFAEATDPILVGESVSSIAIADLGLRGELGDLVVTDHEGGKLRFIGDSQGQDLALAQEYVDIGATEKKVVVTPLRGEGERDIVTVELEGANIRIASVVDDALPNSSYTHDTKLTDLVDVVVADFDDDGDGDIAVVNGACTVRVLINQTVVK